jgi:alginate O-acetyltransferase complex protein AlgI
VAFAIEDVPQLGIYLCRMFPFLGGIAENVNPLDFVPYLENYWKLFLLGIFFATPVPAAFYKVFKKKLFGNIGVIVILALSMYYLAISKNNPFLYFNF